MSYGGLRVLVVSFVRCNKLVEPTSLTEPR